MKIKNRQNPKLKFSVFLLSCISLLFSFLFPGCRSNKNEENMKFFEAKPVKKEKHSVVKEINIPAIAPEKVKENNKQPYKLQVGDEIEISILGKPEMTRRVTILPDGTVSYLLIGEIVAEGKTVEEVRSEISLKLKKLADSIKNKKNEPELRKKENNSGPYKLQVGDILEVSLLDEPDMTRDVVVVPGGTINYLLCGEIKAEGKTIGELRKNIEKKLLKYYVNPEISILPKKLHTPVEEKIKLEKDTLSNLQVSVIVTKLHEEIMEKTASIIGAVKRPGRYEIKDGDRVLDLIAKAGGFLFIVDAYMGGKQIANLKASYIIRNGRRLNVDFDALVRLGNMENNILLKNHDFVYIADSQAEQIFIIGEVYKPTPIPADRDNITLAEAIARAGGFTREASRSRVIVLRNTCEGLKALEVDMEALLYGDSDEKNVRLKGGDIVFIPEQGISRYARYTDYLMTFADALLKAYQVREAVRFPKLKRGETP